VRRAGFLSPTASKRLRDRLRHGFPGLETCRARSLPLLPDVRYSQACSPPAPPSWAYPRKRRSGRTSLRIRRGAMPSAAWWTLRRSRSSRYFWHRTRPGRSPANWSWQAAGPGGRYITEQTKEAEDRVLVQHQPSDARRTARRARCRRLRRESPVGSRSGRRARAAATVQSAPQPTFAPMVFVLRRAARSPRELVAEHRQAADGCFLCHLVLDDVPVLGQLAVLEAHDIHHDPVRRPA
jgi:hypothetical protein